MSVSGISTLSRCVARETTKHTRILTRGVYNIKREREDESWKRAPFPALLFADNAALKHVAAFCDPGIMRGDVGVYSAHYRVSSSVHCVRKIWPENCELWGICALKIVRSRAHGTSARAQRAGFRFTPNV